MTNHTDNVIKAANEDLARLLAEIKEEDAAAKDIIWVCPDKHGKDKAGFRCSISNRQTYSSGTNLAGFAQAVFGTGTLRRRPTSPQHTLQNDGDVYVSYLVLMSDEECDALREDLCEASL